MNINTNTEDERKLEEIWSPSFNFIIFLCTLCVVAGQRVSSYYFNRILAFQRFLFYFPWIHRVCVWVVMLVQWELDVVLSHIFFLDGNAYWDWGTLCRWRFLSNDTHSFNWHLFHSICLDFFFFFLCVITVLSELVQKFLICDELSEFAGSSMAV